MNKLHTTLFLIFIILQIAVSEFIPSCIVLGGYIFLDDMLVLLTKSKYLTENNRSNRIAVYGVRILGYLLFLVFLIFDVENLIILDRADVLAGIAIVIAFESISNSIEKLVKI